jgi:hypothetical protein
MLGQELYDEVWLILLKKPNAENQSALDYMCNAFKLINENNKENKNER